MDILVAIVVPKQAYILTYDGITHVATPYIAQFCVSGNQHQYVLAKERMRLQDEGHLAPRHHYRTTMLPLVVSCIVL